ncbi:MarR family winged helix-turn-helix transcriptional regulator [Microbacterium sediminicola]
MPHAERPPAELAAVLRSLAWTVHNGIPDRAGIEPVPRTELSVLKEVLEHPGATVGELSRIVGMHQPNVSAAIRRLEARDLVRSGRSDTDRRVNRISPTERAFAEQTSIIETWMGSLGEAFATLPDAQRAALTDALGGLQALDDALRDRSGPSACRDD